MTQTIPQELLRRLPSIAADLREALAGFSPVKNPRPVALLRIAVEAGLAWEPSMGAFWFPHPATPEQQPIRDAWHHHAMGVEGLFGQTFLMKEDADRLIRLSIEKGEPFGDPALMKKFLAWDPLKAEPEKPAQTQPVSSQRKGIVAIRQQCHPERYSKKFQRDNHNWLRAARGPKHQSSGHFQRRLLDLGILNPETAHTDDAATLVALMWALHCWEQGNRPVYVLERTLAESLSQTNLLSIESEADLPLPWLPCIYLQTGPLFELENIDGSASAPLDGIYICVDRLLDDAERDSVALHIFCAPVENDLGVVLLRWSVMPGAVEVGGELAELSEARSKMQRAVALALNFITAWQKTHALQVTPIQPTPPKSQGKRKRMERRGKSFLPYTQVSLSQTATRYVNSTALTNPREGTVRRHLCGMHWHRYWVRRSNLLDIDKPDATKLGATEDLCRVTRLVAPHWRGRGKAAPKTVHVVQ